ncbi:MAG: SdpI family protein [Ferruginibacter sp.]
MKTSKLLQRLFPFIMMALPWVYVAIIWKELPAIIPTHFGPSGAPDKFGEKYMILFAPLAMTVVGIGTYFLLLNIHRIDPKKKYTATTSAVMAKIAVVVIVLLSAISMLICYWTLKGRVEGLSVLTGLLGLFMAYLGNLFYSIKPNYFAGFRLPWALENEENWRQTHRLASKVWFAGGLLLALAGFVLPNRPLIIVLISLITVMVLVPTIFSYNFYRKGNPVTNSTTEK